MNYKRKSRRRFFLLMRLRTPPISSELRGRGGGFEHPNPPLSVRHCPSYIFPPSRPSSRVPFNTKRRLTKLLHYLLQSMHADNFSDIEHTIMYLFYCDTICMCPDYILQYTALSLKMIENTETRRKDQVINSHIKVCPVDCIV